MNTETQNPILAKIAKLHAAASNGRTEEEAASFAAKVQDLLQENGLTIAQVEAAGGNTGDIGGTRERRGTSHRAMYEYQRNLMAALARNNFCLHVIEKITNAKPLYSGGRGKTSRVHILIGRSINVMATEQMYEYIETTMRRLGAEAGIDYRKTREFNFFLDGACTRIIERLNERRYLREREERAAAAERAQQAQGNGTGKELVLSDVYGTEADLNNDFVNNYPVGTTAARRRDARAKEAVREAREKDLIAGGMDKTVAFYVSHGYGPDEAKTYADNWRKQTARSGGRGRSQNWTSGDQKHHEKINSASYQAGREAGGTIGLDTQVGASKRKLLK